MSEQRMKGRKGRMKVLNVALAAALLFVLDGCRGVRMREAPEVAERRAAVRGWGKMVPLRPLGKKQIRIDGDLSEWDEHMGPMPSRRCPDGGLRASTLT